MPDIVLSCPIVTTITPHGFWLEYGDEELYLPFVDFPWFEYATISQISRVECVSAARLYWPALDLDLSMASIRDPAAASMNAASRDN